MSGITFRVNLQDRALGEALSRLGDSLDDMTPIMHVIGRALVSGAQDRIALSNQAPDGTPWEQSQRAGEKGGKTLLDTYNLYLNINHHAARDHVLVGSPVPYSAVHQFGAAAGSLGVTSGIDKRGRHYTVASPWGDIPARPYLGVSDEEEEDILEQIGNALTRAIQGGSG